MDIVLGGAGNDTIKGGEDNDILLGDQGRITLVGGIPTLVTSEGGAGGGADTLMGDAGDDILIGGAGSDVLTGGDGFDTLVGDGGMVSLFGGRSWTVLSIADPGGAEDFLDGGSGTDILLGGEGTDSMRGRFPEDVLIGGAGRVVVQGGKIVSIFPPINMLFGSPLSGGADTTTTDGLFATGPVVTVIGIVPETGAEFMPGTGFIFEEGFTNAGSYTTYGGPRYSGPQAYLAMMDLGGLRAEGAAISTRSLPDGTVERVYASGTIETIAPDGTVTRTLTDGTVIVTKPDGSMRISLPDGTVRTLLPDGTAITALPDGTTVSTLPDGSVITVLPDGTTVRTLSDGTTVTTPPEKTASRGPRVAQVEVKTQEDAEERLAGKAMDLGSLVAGLAGWGLASPGSSGGPSLLNREGFDELERGRKLRRFRRWRNGAFEKVQKSGGSQTDNNLMQINNWAGMN